MTPMDSNQQHPLAIALGMIISEFNKRSIPYMVFGGIANSIYGNPRQTFDIDIKFILDSDIEDFIEWLKKIGNIVPKDPKQFITETNVVPVDIENVRVDLVIADLPFEREAISRSHIVNFLGVQIRVCTPEDLIIQKAISVRDKDWMDIRYIIENMNDKLDWGYLVGHCKELADFLDDPEIYNRIEKYRNE